MTGRSKSASALFICGGAFVGLEEIVAKRLGRGAFGFDQLAESGQVGCSVRRDRQDG